MTSSITVSPRIREVLTRFIDVYYEPAIRRSATSSGGQLYHKHIGKFNIEYNCSVPEHDDDCEYEDEVSEEHDCKCSKYMTLTVVLQYISIGHRYTFLDSYDMTIDLGADKEEIFDWVKKLPDTYQLCVCGEKAEKDNWCYNCYIFRYTRSEDEGGNCCVCLENEGRWTKLRNCGHIIHSHCWDKIKISTCCSTCPLCRQLPAGHDMDPYDV